MKLEKHVHEEREALVRRLHDEGRGTNEIARASGLHSSVVWSIKRKLGVGEPSAARKRWVEIEHAARTLESSGIRLREMTTLLQDVGSVDVDDEEVKRCVKQLTRSLETIRSLRSSLRGLLPPREVGK